MSPFNVPEAERAARPERGGKLLLCCTRARQEPVETEA